MRIKKLTAGHLACILLALNMTGVCLAAGQDAEIPVVTSDEAGAAGDAEAEAVSETEGAEMGTAPNTAETEKDTADTPDNVTMGGAFSLPFGSMEELEQALSDAAGDGDWYQVVVKERTGYVHKDYVDVIKQAASGGKTDSDMMALLLYLMMAGQTGNSDNPSAALTPDGNLSLVDEYTEKYVDGPGKQFITVTTKDGNYFYLVIDRDKDGNENVHFMNLVDEAADDEDDDTGFDAEDNEPV